MTLPNAPSIKLVLFDLDNTLYPASCSMTDEMEGRMGRFVSSLLCVPYPEAAKLRQMGYEKYGTTLRWLQVEKGLTDPQLFLNAVHPENIHDFVPADTELRRTLDAISLPKAVLTNSPMAHANRVLSYFNIADCFTHVYDLVFNGYVGKPEQSAYQRVLADLGLEAREVLFLDDVPSYLESFHQLGGTCILVDEMNRHPNSNFKRIKRVHELPELLQNETF